MRNRFLAQCLFLIVLVVGLSFVWLPMSPKHTNNHTLAVADEGKTAGTYTDITSTAGAIVQVEKQNTDMQPDTSLGEPVKIKVSHPTWLKVTSLLISLVSLAGGVLLLRSPR